MDLNTCEMLSYGIEIAFFPKVAKNCLAAMGFAPRLPSFRRLSYTSSSLLNTSPRLDICTF